jgi:hypothetical protein
VQVLSLDIRSVHQGRGGGPRPADSSAFRVGSPGDRAGVVLGAAGNGSGAAVATAARPSTLDEPPPLQQGQRYELYYDRLYLVFTVRDALATPAPGPASASGSIPAASGITHATSTPSSLSAGPWICVESVTVARHPPLEST